MTEIALPSDSPELHRARHPERALAEAVADGKVKMTDILKSVGIDPTNPTHQAALLACEKYDLDPVMKHILVIPRSGIYITRDGWLHIAHRDGQFDGMEVIETGETPTHCRVATNSTGQKWRSKWRRWRRCGVRSLLRTSAHMRNG